MRSIALPNRSFHLALTLDNGFISADAKANVGK